MKEQINYKGYVINVHFDEHPENPREWDNLGTISHWHRNMNIGDEEITCGVYEWIAGMLDIDLDTYMEWHDERGKSTKDGLLKLFNEKYIALDMYCYEHGGITISTSSFSCPWDSGQCGIIWVSKEDVLKAYPHYKIVTKNLREEVERMLKGEVETFDQYLTGQVFGFSITVNGEETDSCWGFYEEDYMVEEAKSLIDIDISIQNAKAINYRKIMIRNRVPLEYRIPYSAIVQSR